MQKIRYTDNREHRFVIFQPRMDDPILVVCPRCNSKALIFPHLENTVKCICTKCTFYNYKSPKIRYFQWHKENPTDGYFSFPLWLQIKCCGNSLWAFNQKHLNILDLYVQAALREHKTVKNEWCCNSSVVAKLPKWIKSYKNRDQIIKAIQKLREKL
ncbi:hypothetical protein NIES4102_08490 [Chondrocystis sp. NIES-4102]|nr:hypothetical protein NIES4102_08490 [Chondrocystis sp. NIES-4102]